MLLCFVHGGWRYEIKVEGPYLQPRREFPSIHHAMFWIKDNPQAATTLMEGERLILREIETGRYIVINDNGYKSLEEGDDLWLKEGF